MNKALLIALSALFIFMTGADAREVKVHGYTKKDGTKVEGYTRSEKDPATVEVKGYTKKDGTKVAGYTRRAPKKTK